MKLSQSWMALLALSMTTIADVHASTAHDNAAAAAQIASRAERRANARRAVASNDFIHVDKMRLKDSHGKVQYLTGIE